MAGSILETIAQATRERVAQARASTPLEELRERALAAVAARESGEGFPFEAALAQPGMSFICECKKASPSKGLIAADFPYLDIARSYEDAGAAAISCLTEPQWFQGSLQYLQDIADAVRIPVLRKDFLVDEYMVYEAAVAGAAAVLLICSILTPRELAACLQLAHELGMSALVEAHDEQEVRMALSAGARVVGVNNRNLKDFTVDFGNSIRLRGLVPDDVLFVTESGVKTAQDVELLAQHGVDAVLIGETLMRAADKRAMLAQLGSLV